jgi:hypothetical protein
MSPGSFPRQGILDAAGSADPAFLATPEAAPVLRAEAKALSRMGRHAEAAAIWTRLGEQGAARRSAERAARRMESLARQAPDPEEQVMVYRRLLAGWPDTPAARRTERRLAEAEDQLNVMTLVTPAEVTALGKAWTEAGWSPPPVTSKTQLRLLHDGRVQWRPRADGEWQQYSPEPEVFDRLTASLREVRLEKRVAKVLDEPRERKRIPLLLEASAVPGVDFTPGLVPADIPGAERRLFE